MESIISDRFVRELACVTENVSMHRQMELVGLPRENLEVRGVSFLLSGPPPVSAGNRPLATLMCRCFTPNFVLIESIIGLEQIIDYKLKC